MDDGLDFVDQLLAETDAGSQIEHRAWMDEKTFTLGTEANIGEMIDACIESGRYSIDLETSGLDNRVFDGSTVDKIAGICLSPDGERGYYIPVGHVTVDMDGNRSPSPNNVPWRIAHAELQRLVVATEEGKTVAIFHNGKFDQEFLQFNGDAPLGVWDRPKIWDDTLILAYLGNSRKRDKRLKSLSKELLGIDQVELKELFPEDWTGDLDFTTLDPTSKGVLWYTGGDGICTWLLYPILAPAVIDPDTDGQTQRTIYSVEKGCTASTRWMERNRIHISKEKVRELIRLGQQEWFDSIMEVYAEAQTVLGRDVMPGKYKALRENFDPDDPHNLLPAQLVRAEALAKVEFLDPATLITGRAGKEWPPIYDVNSPQKLGTMFDEMGVPNLKRTEKSGQIKTSKDELERVIEETGASFPFMGKIKRFREVNKALSSYLYPMLLDSDPTDDSVRINFNGYKVDTGRFSTPAKDAARGRLIGWPALNLQSIPATYDPNRPACMTRLRECITPRKEDAYIVAIDYAGVELRIVTNLSREPKWLTEFFHCSSCNRTFPSFQGKTTPAPPPERCPTCGSDKIGDLHTLTALSIYGQDATEKDNWKALRGYAKATNFALCYGGGGTAVQRATGVDKNEGWRIKNVFDKTYSGLKGWWSWQHQFGRQHGYVRTAFGRRYPVPDITSQEGGFRSKAERNAINGPIQGTSADITKAAMAFVYKECKKRGWLDKVKMIITMHDELVFEIDGDVLEAAIHVLVPIMTRSSIIMTRNWPVPLTCDVEIGRDWTVPWDLNSMRHGEVRFDGNKKIKKKDWPSDAAIQYDNLANFPQQLETLFVQQTPGVPLSMATPPGMDPVANPSEHTPQPMARVEVPDNLPTSENVSAEPPAGAAGFRPPVTDAPQIEMGAPYEYKLNSPLSVGMIATLAEIIVEASNGTEASLRELRLLDLSGKVLPLKETFGVNVPRVVVTTFHVLAKHKGL